MLGLTLSHREGEHLCSIGVYTTTGQAEDRAFYLSAPRGCSGEDSREWEAISQDYV